MEVLFARSVRIRGAGLAERCLYLRKLEGLCCRSELLTISRTTTASGPSPCGKLCGILPLRSGPVVGDQLELSVGGMTRRTPRLLANLAEKTLHGDLVAREAKRKRDVRSELICWRFNVRAAFF
jgi:hypothetical protein